MNINSVSPSPIQQPIILQMQNITKRFPGVVALDDVSFDVYKGEVHCLMGENGAGKSTLMKILTGIYQADHGQILIENVQQTIKTPVDAQKLGIAMIHQELNLLPEMSVVENFFLGREIVRHGVLQKRQMREIVVQKLDELQANFSPDTLIKNLSVGQQQLVEIARALSIDAKIIIMDEPTAALGVPEQRKVISLIHQLKAQGRGIIFISHNLQDIFAVSDRIIVMRRGVKAGERKISETTHDEVVKLMIGG